MPQNESRIFKWMKMKSSTERPNADFRSGLKSRAMGPLAFASGRPIVGVSTWSFPDRPRRVDLDEAGAVTTSRSRYDRSRMDIFSGPYRDYRRGQTMVF